MQECPPIFLVVERCDVKFNGKTEDRAFRLIVPEDYGPESSLGPSSSSLGLGNDRDVRRRVADFQNTIVEGEVTPGFCFEEAKNELASINPKTVRGEIEHAQEEALIWQAECEHLKSQLAQEKFAWCQDWEHNSDDQH